MFRGLSLLAGCVFLTATVVVALQAPVHPTHVTSADAVEFMPVDPKNAGDIKVSSSAAI